MKSQNEYKQHLDNFGIEALIAELRREGHSKVSSIGILCKLGLYSLAEAKSVVHLSPSWADVRERDEEVEDMFWQVLEDEARRQNDQR